jgi:hypothetical protein
MKKLGAMLLLPVSQEVTEVLEGPDIRHPVRINFSKRSGHQARSQEDILLIYAGSPDISASLMVTSKGPRAVGGSLLISPS